MHIGVGRSTLYLITKGTASRFPTVVFSLRCQYISRFLLESSLASLQETQNGKFLNGCQALKEEDAEESLDGLGARDTGDRHSRTR